MSSTTPIPTTTGTSEEYIEKAASVMAAAFASDPLNRYAILSTDSAPNSTVITNERRAQNFLTTIRDKIKAGAFIVEAGNWGAVSVWYPPGIKTLFSDIESNPAWVSELYSVFGEVKKRRLGERNYWYLNLVARQPDRTEPGLVRAAMEPHLKKASEEGLPVWIEATTTHSRDVYTHMGFRLIDSVQIGAGKADRDGNARFGGEGTTVYCMIAEPKV